MKKNVFVSVKNAVKDEFIVENQEVTFDDDKSNKKIASRLYAEKICNDLGLEREIIRYGFTEFELESPRCEYVLDFNPMNSGSTFQKSYQKPNGFKANSNNFSKEIDTRKHYLVEAGLSPRGIKWFDFIRANDIQEATREANKSGYGEVLYELTTRYKESIGIAVFDYGIPNYQLKPVVEKIGL